MSNYYTPYETSPLIKRLFSKGFATLLTITLALFSSPSLKASHYSSGEIFYEWIGNEPGKDSMAYRVYATLFRNVGGANIGTGNLNACAFRANGSASIGITLSYQRPAGMLNPNYTISPGNPYGWKNTGPHPSDASGWNMPDPNVCAVSNKTISEYRYVGEVTLTSRASDWSFAILPPCCRDGNDNLASSGNFYLSADLNNSNGPNSSPRILSFTQFALCAISDSARPLRLNLRAQDGDGDSLFYQFDPNGSVSGNGCSNSTKLGFMNPYSANFPFPAHRKPFFNQNTAQLIFSPSMAGSFVVKIQVVELRPDTNGIVHVRGHSTLEFMLSISSTCKKARNGFITTASDTVVKRQCGDSTLTVNTSERFDQTTLEPNATDFALLTSQNSLVPLKSVELKNESNFHFSLRDTFSINDTMTLIIRKGLDSNTVFNICGIGYQDFDTLATVISSGCKVDTSSGVGLTQLPADLLSLYPNPASDYVQFKSPYPLGNSHFQLLNSTGIIVKQGSIAKAEKRIRTTDLSPGVYWIRLLHDDFTTVKKFIKK